MSSYPSAFAEFKNSYDFVTGVLSIEEAGSLLIGFRVLFDGNSFDRDSIPSEFQGFPVTFYDVRRNLEMFKEIEKESSDSATSRMIAVDSIISKEINRLQSLLDKVELSYINRIIFLDIDGVFNSNKYFKSKFYLESTADLTDAQVMLEQQWHMIDPDAVLLFNRLVTESKAQVVLSSTWRASHTPVEMTKILRGRGATFEVTASTPKLFGKISARIPRGKEIKAYLKKLPKQPESFVIIDDLSDMLDVKDRLIQTDAKVGLTELDVERALRMLGVTK